MRILYSLGIQTYRLGVRTASLWNDKARLMCQGWTTSLKAIQSLSPGKTAWFHASSLGEYEQARPILEQFKRDHQDYRIVLTFFSPSGYEIRKDYKGADLVCYLPMDTPKNAKRFVETVSPSIVFFVKYDFFFNYLNELKIRNIPTYIFSAIFRPSHYFFQWYGGWFCNQLNCYNHIFVQNQESLQLLKSHGIEHCSLAGDTRFDRVHDIALSARRFPEIEAFIDGKPVLMAGSSWLPDEENIKYCLDRYAGDLKVVLAPHIIEEEHLQAIETLFGANNCIRFTQMGNKTHADKKVLIIDTMGMLSSMYQYATVAYIGGAFGHGLHNILEALTFGKPVCFGPRYRKFQEAKDILALGGGFTYTHPDNLLNQLTIWLGDSSAYSKASQVCLDYVNKNIGSTQTILSRI